MNKVDKSQVKVLSLIAFLLVITHFLPYSLRPTYLYLIFNILIIALGAQAGLLSDPSEDKKHHVSMSSTQKHAMQELQEKENSSINNANYSVSDEHVKKPKVIEKSATEKKIVFYGESKVDKMKKSPSMPSLFYIEDGEDDLEGNKDDEEVEVEDEICGVNGQELFAKAETFIGNFYKQLKMQREESCAS